MNRPERPPLQPQRPGIVAKLYHRVQSIMLIGTLLLIAYWFWSGGRPIPLAQGPPSLPQAFTPESAQNVELATFASVQRQQLIAAKLKQREALAAFDELGRDLREWEREMAAWQSEGPPLLQNAEGKRLAADTALVSQIRAVFKEERPGIEDLRAARKRAEEVIFPVRESLKNAEDASPPSDYAVTAIRETQSEARKARERYRQARQAVSVLLTEAPPAGPKTLEQAIMELGKEEALQRVATIEAAERKAREEATRLVAQEKAKVIQTEAEAEAQRLRDEAAQKKQASELAAAKSVEEMELKQKEATRDIERLRAIAEQRRQGDLVSGSIWKGTYALNGRQTPGTMTIESRVKDKITGSMDYGAIPYSFTGTVNGNSVKFTPSQGMSMDMEFSCMLNPASKIITGRAKNATFTLRLSDGSED